MTMTRPGTPDVHVTAAAPPPELRFRRPFDLQRFLRELWRARGLMRTLTERDLRARYKQAMLGVAWAFIGPVGFAVVFSVFFNHVAKVPTGNVPSITLSWALLLAGVLMYVRDVRHGLPLLMQLLLFATPVAMRCRRCQVRWSTSTAS